MKNSSLKKMVLSIVFVSATSMCAQTTAPRSEPTADAAPLETAKPNVPEFKPAFAGQTRAPAVKTQAALDVRELAKDLNYPWALAFLPDGRMLVTEKLTGKLLIVTAEGKKSPPAQGLPAVDAGGQGGLLDVEVSPDFADSKRIFWSYYEPRQGGNGLAVARGRLLTEGDTPSVKDVEVIFRMQPTLDSNKHAGGRIVFAPNRDDLLFITLGERSVPQGRAQAQSLSSHFGKVVRIHADGSIPKDNPFVGTANARPEIWSKGHRNVLAGAFDPQGQFWIVEMGPRGGDELNLVEKGQDYGWPTIGYGEDYSGAAMHETTQAEGMTQPVYYWDPVISPSALAIYTGPHAEWKGNFFIGGLSSQALVRLVLKDGRVVGEERLLTQQHARIREVVQGPDGALYLLTDDERGKLLRVAPAKAK